MEQLPHPKQIDVVLFDLGGVLVEWVGIKELPRLVDGKMDAETARRFWLVSPSVRKFERGEISPQDFARGMLDELDLDLEVEDFLDLFLSWDKGPLPGAHDLLESMIESETRIACLSNNNELHWKRIRDDFGFGPYFEKTYLSHEIGAVKPDAEIFEFVLSDLQMSPERLLFLDDNRECVDQAREMGFRSHVVQGVPAARRVLQSFLGDPPTQA